MSPDEGDYGKREVDQRAPARHEPTHKGRDPLSKGVVYMLSGLSTAAVGIEGRRGPWGTPTMALHIRIQHR